MTTTTRNQQAGSKQRLVWILTEWRHLDEFRFSQFSNGIPRVYVRDHDGLDDSLPYFAEFKQICKRFHQRDGEFCEGGGIQAPIQVAVELLPEFGFSKRIIRVAMKMANSE